MLPLFKTHFSIGGRSILTEKDVIRLHKRSGNDYLFLVEDSLMGFRKVNKECLKENINLIFGLRINSVQEDINSETPSKIVLFARNSNGIKFLRKVYSEAFINNHGILKINWLKDQKDRKHLNLFIPFYDSFLSKNIFNFGMCNLFIDEFDPFFFLEDNDHPFDFLIKESLANLVSEEKLIKSKSIFYEKREDFKAFQMFKSFCNRQGGKTPTFDNPNVRGLCSAEFCFESWEEKNK